jgi:hypothetical protein
MAHIEEVERFAPTLKGYSATSAGAALLPRPLVIAMTAPMMGRLPDMKGSQHLAWHSRRCPSVRQATAAPTSSVQSAAGAHIGAGNLATEGKRTSEIERALFFSNCRSKPTSS